MAIDHSVTYRNWSVKNLGHRQRLAHIERTVRAIELGPNPSFADVGCSNGFVTDRLREALGLPEADGYDYVVDHFELGRARHPRIRFSAHDLCAVPLPRKYSLVTCFETLEHVGDLTLAVKNLVASVRPGGHLLISVPVEYGPLGAVKYVLKRRVYGYRLDELPGGEAVAWDYWRTLVTSGPISRFRTTGRAGWGTHFGFDSREVGEVLERVGLPFKSWRSLFTDFFLVHGMAAR